VQNRAFCAQRLLGRGTEAVAIPLADLAQGRAGIRRVAGMPSRA
jgi:hypothetical protein